MARAVDKPPGQPRSPWFRDRMRTNSKPFSLNASSPGKIAKSPSAGDDFAPLWESSIGSAPAGRGDCQTCCPRPQGDGVDRAGLD